MDKLSVQERAAMIALWKAKKGSVHDILAQHELPAPHKNTLTSTLKNLIQKELAGFKKIGNTYEYFPMVSKTAFAKKYFKNFLHHFFDNSVESLLSFIAGEKNLSADDLDKIKKIIDKNKGI
jgi:BlaI family penicillinase repressor